MMKPERILSSDLLDIIFDQRNKEYGAYELRKAYQRRLLIALCSVPVLAGLFFGMNYLNKAFGSDQIVGLPFDSAVVKLIDIPQQAPKPEKPLVAPKQKPVATIRNTPPVIVPDNTKADPPPPADDLLNDNRAISNSTVDGEPPTSSTSPAPAAPAGTGEGPAAPAAPEVEKVVTAAEVMPEFPGGLDALRRFLGRNLRVPENVQEAGQRIKAPVRFVVNKSGELSDVEFLVQVDDSIKKEVLRVMHKMPKWKPGSQNGKTVAVYFVIPIIFEPGE